MNWTEAELAEYMAKQNVVGPICDSYPPDNPDPGLESGLQAKCIAYCKNKGWRLFHDRSRKKNEPGWPDNFIFLPEGRVLLIELKSSAGQLRKEQKELRRDLHWCKHPVHIVRSFKRFVEIVEASPKS